MKEVSIFDYIRCVLFTKKDTFDNSAEDQLNFQPYMLQRWCSMSSTDISLILNETTNRWFIENTSKQHMYKLLHTILPKQKFKKINYIKKSASANDSNNIKEISIVAELSQREINNYLNF